MFLHDLELFSVPWLELKMCAAAASSFNSYLAALGLS